VGRARDRLRRAEHKKIKNELCSRGIFEHYREEDYVGKRIDAERKIVEFARPAGVIFGLVPSTNPVSTVFYKIVLALLTATPSSSARIPWPRPAAPMRPGSWARRRRRRAPRRRGAGDRGADHPLIEALMADARTDVILATGGVAVVRAAYRSGNPAIGVGPGNAPVFVDATPTFPRRPSASSPANPSTTRSSAPTSPRWWRRRRSRQAGAPSAERGRPALRRRGPRAAARLPVSGGKFNLAALGKDAAWIAKEAGLRVPARTKILLAPFELAVPEEPFAREKLCPVLGYIRVPHAKRGIDVSRAIMRIAGSGHSAASIAATQDDHGLCRNLQALRVAVNSPCSTGAAASTRTWRPR